jgi:hypothetical protein
MVRLPTFSGNSDKRGNHCHGHSPSPTPTTRRAHETGLPGMMQAMRRHTINVARLPEPFGSADADTVRPYITAVMSLETYPLSTAPDIDVSRVQRVADAMYQLGMLTRQFNVSSMPQS